MSAGRLSIQSARCVSLASLFLLSLIVSSSPWAQSVGEQTAILIAPGDPRFDTPEFQDFEATYTSASATGGSFTLLARKTGNHDKVALIDIIATDDAVIVSQRQIDLFTHYVDYKAGPYFAWGQDFVVSQHRGAAYNWTRVPIGAGAPVQLTGEWGSGGAVDEMFSPTLASLMPIPVGQQFQLPRTYPRKGGTVSVEHDLYTVLRRERRTFAAGQTCDCWVLERKPWSGGIENIWVSRKAPFVMRRVRDVGTDREFASDLLSFRSLN